MKQNTNVCVLDSSSPNNKLSSNTFFFETSSLKQLITKKTLRGRKIKSPLPKTKRCCICLEFDELTSKPLITCSVCQCVLHASCYHLPIPNNSDFTCERCTEAINSNVPLTSFSCFICAGHDGVLIKNSFADNYYHKTCLRLIPELYEGKQTEEHFTRENIRKWRYKNSCRYCQDKLSKSKAVIKCSNSKCKEYYHIPCAIEKGMIFSLNYIDSYYNLNTYNQSIPFYCSCHNKRIAAAYRSDVIYNKTKDEKEYQHCLVKHNKNKTKRKFSVNSVDSEDNISTLGNNPSTTEDEQCDSCYNGMNFFFDKDDDLYHDLGNNSNNVLELNFNELLFDNIPNETVVSPNVINFENISPKIHMNIPFEF